ncbi:MAG: hypothetical protein P8J86_07760 [Phycisphaerales bacterium]|nr:hypothetical protein [Phycisphaerales bacterium]
MPSPSNQLPGSPVLSSAQMHCVKPNKPVIGYVTESWVCSRSQSPNIVRHVGIDVTGTPLAGKFIAGQSFGVIPVGLDKNGKPHKVRLYSIACSSKGEDGKGGVLSTTVKRLIEEHKPQHSSDHEDQHDLFLGICSNQLCDLKIGAPVNVSGPNGRRFVLPENRELHDYLFVATGTGIAPFRGMIQELFPQSGDVTERQVHLVMGVPYSTDLLYHDEFCRYAAQYDNFHYHIAVSRERPDGWQSDGPGRGIYVGQAIELRWDLIGPMLEQEGTLIYVCGIEGMQLGIFQSLVRHGLEASYLDLKDDLRSTPYQDWTVEQVRRMARPTSRCMLEVYD